MRFKKTAAFISSVTITQKLPENNKRNVKIVLRYQRMLY